MKALATTILGLAALVSGCSQAPDPNVARVLQEREKAVTITEDPRHPGRNFILPFDRAIQKIDASGCPKDFQLAWINYQTAWHVRIASQRAKNDKVAGDLVLMLLPQTALVGSAHAVRDAAAPTHDTIPDWAEVKKQAIMCNVPIPSPSGNF